ncbi:hypothetical protein LINPERPRIM_LOCUS18951 [Linum perenne]
MPPLSFSAAAESSTSVGLKAVDPHLSISLPIINLKVVASPRSWVLSPPNKKKKKLGWLIQKPFSASSVLQFITPALQQLDSSFLISLSDMP